MNLDLPSPVGAPPPPPATASHSTPRPDGVQALARPEPADRPDPRAATLDAAARAANQRLESIASQIRFNVSSEAGRTVVKMVDTQTHEVLLQIPNAQMMEIANDPDRLAGVAVNRKA
jgi:flagellar protein FlaG